MNLGAPPLLNPAGRMITASGTICELDSVERTLRRLPLAEPTEAIGVVSVPLRRDGEVLRVIEIVQLQLGQRATCLLEPLGTPPVTLARRSTALVIAFEHLDLPTAAIE